MTLRGAYESGFQAACLCALLIVLLGGEMPLATWLAIPALLFSNRLQARTTSTWIGTGVGFAGLFAGLGIVAVRGVETLILGASVALVALLVGRTLTRSNLTHDVQALLLTLLLVFAGAGLHTDLTYGLLFVAYSICAIWALLTRQLVDGAHREAARKGGASVENTLARKDVVTPIFFGVSATLSILVLASTVVVFVVFPRVGIGRFGMTLKSQRLPDNVSLSGPPRAGGSSDIVARVSGVDESEYNRGLYLRAATYDVLTRDGFSRTAAAYRAPSRLLRQAPRGESKRYDVFLHPVASDRLATLGPVAKLDIVSGGSANPSLRVRLRERTSSGDLRLEAPLTGSIRYRIKGHINTPFPSAAPDAPDKIPEPLEPWTELPADTDERVVELARATAGQGSISVRAGRIRSFLVSNFDYTLNQPTAGESDPLASFLFDAKAGHCEHFATAFAAMLRAIGIPSRVVGGFQGGLWDDSSEVVVFALNHAHAWVEWYQPGRGWVTDDATPAFEVGMLGPFATLAERARRAWDDYILDYGLLEQTRVFRSATRGLSLPRLETLNDARMKRFAAAIAFVLAFIGVATMYILRRHRAGSTDGLARALNSALQHEGHDVLATETFREVLGATGLENEPVFRDANRLYEARRFGTRAVDDSAVSLAIHRLRQRRDAVNSRARDGS